MAVVAVWTWLSRVQGTQGGSAHQDRCTWEHTFLVQGNIFWCRVLLKADTWLHFTQPPWGRMITFEATLALVEINLDQRMHSEAFWKVFVQALIGFYPPATISWSNVRRLGVKSMRVKEKSSRWSTWTSAADKQRGSSPDYRRSGKANILSWRQTFPCPLFLMFFFLALSFWCQRWPGACRPSPIALQFIKVKFPLVH